MKQIIIDLWSNSILMAALIAWAAAQLIKTVIHVYMTHEWRADRLWGSGGMPSSHAATVCALTVSALLHYGLSSPIFAISAIIAAVVLHDASGVRHETDKQAILITAILTVLESKLDNKENSELPEIKLKDLVGHTPFQVIVGSAIGIIVGLLIN